MIVWALILDFIVVMVSLIMFTNGRNQEWGEEGDTIPEINRRFMSEHKILTVISFVSAILLPVLMLV